ncbi:MAG: cobalamin-dependent protein, partial [Candidatus Omnitrophica bacterium]|nr:cobalamin-dependent protein [Candidatus Omnitrophota bacterium]
MRITFVALGWEQLSISMLTALAKLDGHEVNLAFSPGLFHDRYNLHVPFLAAIFDDRAQVLKTIAQQKPDVLAFSAMTGTYQWMLGIARDAKRMNPNVKILFGGVHASAVPDRVLQQKSVDFVCVGEGDMAFRLMLQAIARKNFSDPIPNTRYKAPDGTIVRGAQTGFIQDLDSLPGFDKSLWEDHIRLGDIYFTMASRGCPFRCTYCFNSFFSRLGGPDKTKYVRQRSAGHMLQELRYARRRYHLRLVEFEDDIFTFNKKWLKDFLDQYKKEIGIPFQCLSHPSFMDDDVIRWLSEAGCRFVQMGIQSADEDFKNRMIKRYEKTRHIERVMQTMRKYHVELKVDHMFGLPEEPVSAQESARELYARIPPYRIQTFWMNYFPGTEMTEYALTNGFLSPEEVENLKDGNQPDFYRNSSRVMAPGNRKLYAAYETIFKLLPIVPPALRDHLLARSFRRLPKVLNSWISFMADVVSGLWRKNPDHIGYAKYYFYHMTRFILAKCGRTMPPATRTRGLERSFPRLRQNSNPVPDR